MAALAAFSQGQDGPRRGFPGGPGGARRDGVGLLPRDLNLTDDQKAQIKKITDSFEESTKSLRDQLKTLHESEPDPFSGTFDEAAVRAAAEARAQVDIELSVARAKLMSQIAAVLTTEQKAQLAAKRAEFAQRPPEPPQ
jgi:Spy/CpxP family protein refolding chaperone